MTGLPLRRLSHDDRGSIFLTGAIALFALALLGAVLLEVGQWYEHRHNLQARTDASALAGGSLFNECFAGVSTASSDIETQAIKYSGLPNGDKINGNTVSNAYNQGWQAGTPGNDGIGFQSNEYPQPGGPLPPRDAFPLNGSDECSNLEFDVKQTQDLPNLFSFSPLSVVHGWARVEEQQVEAIKPSLPIAVPNFDLSAVGVTFFDEATGNELTNCTGPFVSTCTYKLSQQPTTNGQDGEAVTPWTLAPVSISLPPPAAKGDLIGVRVSVGSTVGNCAPNNGSGGGGNNAFACIGLSDLASGLIGIRDYPTGQTAPALYEVLPSASPPCTTSPYFSDLTGQPSCAVTLQARIDSGNGCGSNPETANPHASVTATMPNVLKGGSPYTITLHPVTNPNDCNGNGWLWSGSTTTPLPIDAGSGSSEYPVTIQWSSLQSVNGTNTKSWGSTTTNPAQRFTSGNFDEDGPVRLISLSSGSAYASPPGPDSVGVTVVTSQAGISKQLVVLRQAHNGSATAFMLCVDGGSGDPYSPMQGTPGIQAGMQNGCSFQYGINQSLTSADPCSNTVQLLRPAQCVPNKTSSAGGNPLVTVPLNARFGCASSPPTYPNNWPNFSVPGDKRAVTLLLTSYNAYSNGGQTNGKNLYPVVGFGDFYITGFSGDTCPGDDPAPPQIAADNKNAGDIWGYFIKYDSGNGVPSGVKCVPNALGECVAALVR